MSNHLNMYTHIWIHVYTEEMQENIEIVQSRIERTKARIYEYNISEQWKNRVEEFHTKISIVSVQIREYSSRSQKY